MDQPPIRIGTSAFTAAGWAGTFYPPGLPARDQLSYYAQHFDTVEVDSTYYRTPSLSTVKNWDAKTPKGFIFAAKVPQSITHEKCLTDCGEELTEFVKVMSVLGEKLGPLLFQFPHFNKTAFAGVSDFLTRLVPFLRRLPSGYKFAVEIRNKSWLVPQFADAVRSHGVALTMIDRSWMPQPAEWFERFDPITADFTYVRWLGDRKGIERETKIWNKVIVDRERELSEWVAALERVARLRIPIYVYANNHYAGYGPATVEMFRKLWNAASEFKLPSIAEPGPAPNRTARATSGWLFE
jgi:uncharacterized protein YecE (DUF72 family)